MQANNFNAMGGQPQQYQGQAVVAAAPKNQCMYGDGEWGKHIAAGMNYKHMFKIVQMVDRQGCCYCPTYCYKCTPKLKDRGYLLIGESFIESNQPMCCSVGPFCCGPCMTTCDCVSKQYFDMPPFSPWCPESCCCCNTNSFVSEADTNYCCCCINCVCLYNTCQKPCFGGYVTLVPCERSDSICSCFACATRCLPIWGICPVLNYVKNSEDVTKVLNNQLTAFRQKMEDQGISYRAE